MKWDFQKVPLQGLHEVISLWSLLFSNCFLILFSRWIYPLDTTADQPLVTGEKIMGKYLVLWEVDQTKIPIDPKERGLGWGMLMAMIRKDIEKGVTKDWGAFVGESNGYAISEGTELEIMKSLEQYVPFCIFKVHPIASEGMVNEMIKALTG